MSTLQAILLAAVLPWLLPGLMAWSPCRIIATADKTARKHWEGRS